MDALIRPGTEFARPLQRALRDKMWEHCGVVRSESGLQEGLRAVREISQAAEQIDVRPSSEGYADLAHALDLRSATKTAEATILGALKRCESRGAHNRVDFAELDHSLQVHFDFTLDANGQLVLTVRNCEPISPDLQQLVESRSELPVGGRLLE